MSPKRFRWILFVPGAGLFPGLALFWSFFLEEEFVLEGAPVGTTRLFLPSMLWGFGR